MMRKIFLYQVYTNLLYVPPVYRRVKKLRVLMINKDVRKSLALKKGNENTIWIWNNSTLKPHVLIKTGATVWAQGMLYKAVAQTVLIYGSYSWECDERKFESVGGVLSQSGLADCGNDSSAGGGQRVVVPPGR